jgi:hypothetical protein
MNFAGRFYSLLELALNDLELKFQKSIMMIENDHARPTN